MEHTLSWFGFCLALIIMLIVICFINICIQYPGLLEFTCGKKCMAWNQDDVDFENQEGDFYRTDGLGDSSEDEEDSDIEDKVFPLIKQEEEKKSVNCEVVNELEKNIEKINLIKKQQSIHEVNKAEKVYLLQKQKSTNEDNKFVTMHFIQSQKNKIEDLNGNDALEESSEDDDIEKIVVPIIKREGPGGKEVFEL